MCYKGEKGEPGITEEQLEVTLYSDGEITKDGLFSSTGPGPKGKKGEKGPL